MWVIFLYLASTKKQETKSHGNKAGGSIFVHGG